MAVINLISWACALFFLLLLIYYRNMKERKKEEFIRWGLGVDNCYYYSRPFTVDNQCITVNGFQEVVDEKSAICYSLVQRSWWGKRKVYSQGLIYGDYKDTKSFQIVIKNIPNGENYRIEVFNGFIMSNGRFQIM